MSLMMSIISLPPEQGLPSQAVTVLAEVLGGVQVFWGGVAAEEVAEVDREDVDFFATLVSFDTADALVEEAEVE